MKAANIADLKNRLSAYLQLVRNGEEVVIKDRNVPIARISPYKVGDMPDDERELVAAGVLKLPRARSASSEKFWKDFWASPSADLSEEDAMRAILDERAEGR
jgi:prevent-host-death family protein